MTDSLGRPDKKKQNECEHRQGMWWVKGDTLFLKCRHCLITIEADAYPLRRARRAAANPIVPTA